MDNNEVLDLLKRKYIPLSINQVIEILETKATWCDSALINDTLRSRASVEATTLRETISIIKRINQKPLFYSHRTKIVKDFEEWAHKNNFAVCYENFLVYLEIIGLIRKEVTK